MIAGRERLVRNNPKLVLRLVGIRVGKERLAILQQQGPAAVAASNSRQHTIRATLGDRDFGGDRPRFILEVWRRTLRDTDHSGEVDELAATSGEARTNCRINSRGEAGVERIDVVLPCLDVKCVLQLF